MSTAKFTQRALLGSGLAACILYALAYFEPLHWWGIDFHSYLPIWLGIGSAILGLALARWAASLGLSPRRSIPHWLWSLGIACAMGLLFYKLQIATQLYGDARTVLASLGPGGAAAGKHSLWSALSPNIFSTKNGEYFTYGLASALQHALGCTILEAFRLLTAVLGAVYAGIWMHLVQYKLHSPVLRVLAAAMGLTAGATQVFYGHPEVYAAPILLFTSYLVVLVIYLEGGGGKWLIALTVLLLLAIRSHAAGFALVPTLGYALLAQWAGSRPERRPWLSWRRAGAMIPIACVLAGAVAYLTAFSAGAEKTGASGGAKNIFLQLLADGTADNAYAMFSAWHFWDCWQEMLLCTAPGCVLLLAGVAGLLRKQAWDAPAEVAATMAAGLMCLLFFAVDPLLAMPRDWDLCALQAPGLLVVGLLWLARHQASLKTAWLPLGILLGLSGLQALAVVVNHDPHAVAMRQVRLAQHIVISGHGGGAFILRQTLDAPSIPKAEAAGIIVRFLTAVAPYQNAQNRSEFAFMNQYAGSLHYEMGDAHKALAYYKVSVALEPAAIAVHEDMAVIAYQLKSYAEALSYVQKALAIDGNNPQDWLLAYSIARDQGNYVLALQYGETYLRRWTDMPNLAAELETVRALGVEEIALAPKSPSK